MVRRTGLCTKFHVLLGVAIVMLGTMVCLHGGSSFDSSDKTMGHTQPDTIHIEHMTDPFVSQLFVQHTTTTTPPFTITIYKNGDIASNHIKQMGFWEGGLSHVVSTILTSKPGAYTVVDFGTHVGWFSLLAASKGHHSIGIEAMESNRQALQMSIAANNNFEQRISLHAAALGKCAGGGGAERVARARTAERAPTWRRDPNVACPHPGRLQSSPHKSPHDKRAGGPGGGRPLSGKPLCGSFPFSKSTKVVNNVKLGVSVNTWVVVPGAKF